MNTKQIDCVLTNDPLTRRTYKGCLPIDCLPGDVPSNASFVLNSDPSYLPGEHWICVDFRDSNAVFFDSYALPPSVYSEELDHILHERARVWINQTRLQSENSNVCGLYCIYALQSLARKLSPNKLISPFSDDLARNDFWIAQRFSQQVVTEMYPSKCNLSDFLQTSRISKTQSIYAKYLA